VVLLDLRAMVNYFVFKEKKILRQKPN